MRLLLSLVAYCCMGVWCRLFGGVVPQLYFKIVRACAGWLLQLLVWVGDVLRVLGRHLLDGLCFQLPALRCWQVRAGGVNGLLGVSSRDIRWRIRILRPMPGRDLLAREPRELFKLSGWVLLGYRGLGLCGCVGGLLHSRQRIQPIEYLPLCSVFTAGRC